MVNPGDSVLVESPVYAYVSAPPVTISCVLRALTPCAHSGVIPMFEGLHCDQIGEISLVNNLLSF